MDMIIHIKKIPMILLSRLNNESVVAKGEG